MEFIIGVTMGILFQRGSMYGGGNETEEQKYMSSFRNRSHKNVRKYLMEFLTGEDSAYIPEIQKSFGMLPKHECDYENACEKGQLNILKSMVNTCENKKSLLTTPNFDDEQLFNKVIQSIPHDTELRKKLDRIMQRRRQCILIAAQNGQVHILEWLQKLKGFNFDHQWTVLHFMDKKELFNLWLIAAENGDIKMIKWLENKRRQHDKTSTINSYFDEKIKRPRRNKMSQKTILKETVQNLKNKKTKQIVSKILFSDN